MRAMMPTLLLSLAACLASLSFFPRVSSHCQRFPKSVCEKSSAFVPGHNLAGEGVDITTLARKGAYLVDSSQWQDPNGTCMLCQNPLMGEELQRLPLAGVDWRVHRSCNRQVTSSVQHSDVDVAKVLAGVVKNNWKVDLRLSEGIDFAEKAQVMFAGSQSRMAIYAHKKAQQDRYSFVMHEVSCEFFRLRLLRKPSLLTVHFSHAVASLPSEYDPEEYQHIIDTYGTHYISQVQLGGRVRNLMAMRTCEVALAGLTDSDVKLCLNMEASVDPDILFQFLKAKCHQLQRGRAKGSFWEAYDQRLTEVVGGDSHAELLFSEPQNALLFSEWMEKLQTRPGVVSYSLVPIHRLIARDDPRREVLRKAVGDYIVQRALWKNCTQPCPRGSYKSQKDPCNCVCNDKLSNAMCCARERGIAHLKVRVLYGANLWADYFSAADAYVKVFFRGRELKTSVIQGNNNPKWLETLDFGPVLLTGQDEMRVEIWDQDVKYDDLMETCNEPLEAGRNISVRCPLKYGYVTYSYEVQCGPTLGGPSCHDYVPQKQH